MRDDSTSQVVLRKEMPLLEIRLTKESGQIYEEHSHPMLSIGVMLEGETQFFLQGEEFRLQTGMLAVIPKRWRTLVILCPYKQEATSSSTYPSIFA